jgi:putative transposase
VSKHSKSARFRMRQSGLGGSLTTRSRNPVRVRNLPTPVTLDAATEYRLRCVEHAQRHGVASAVPVFQRSRATIYRWMKRFDPDDLRSLQQHSRRPKTTRKRQWTAAQEQAVLRVRTAHPCYGKQRIRILLDREGVTLSASTIGRILASLRRRTLLIEPRAVTMRRPRPHRPHAIRVPKEKRTPATPGEMVQLDTVHVHPLPGMERRQFTAVDVVSRYGVFGVRSRATAGTAADFLDEIVARMPFPVQAIQVDGGSEFMAEFELACQAQGIAVYVLPPRSPKLNGRVERLNRTSRREFWECYDGELDLPTLTDALRTFETQYNTERPHQALGDLTPSAFLAT